MPPLQAWWQARDSEREKLQADVAKAFAPAAISNFFAVEDEAANPRVYSSFSRVGATGGGFVLSRGVFTRASFVDDSSLFRLSITVNGDPRYEARTTRKAVELLLRNSRFERGTMKLDQRVDVPIGYGFGASAASALSAVLATASVTNLRLPLRSIAYAAHVAEILSQTGLGTVSAIYMNTGAGVITKAGGPGVAKVLRVAVPSGLKIVTASIAPYQKRKALSSPETRIRISAMGKKALTRVVRTPSLKTLAESGEEFAREVGLQTPETKSLIQTAKSAGAIWASQNMIGDAIHCIAHTDEVRKLRSSLVTSTLKPEVRTFEFGLEKSRVLD